MRGKVERNRERKSDRVKEIAPLQFPIKCLIYPLILHIQSSICSDLQRQDCNFSVVMERRRLCHCICYCLGMIIGIISRR